MLLLQAIFLLRRFFSSSNLSPSSNLTYEKALKELEEVISALELGDQTLEDSLALFEQGKKLAAYCMKILEQAELKVKMLSGDELVDFQPEQ